MPHDTIPVAPIAVDSVMIVVFRPGGSSENERSSRRRPSGV
jgi:hypothetical protein